VTTAKEEKLAKLMVERAKALVAERAKAFGATPLDELERQKALKKVFGKGVAPDEAPQVELSEEKKTWLKETENL
jgi:hypothetical protein